MRSIYSPRQIQLATFFGGPFAAAYFLKKGFEAIGKSELAKKAFYISLLFSFILLIGLPFLPEKMPNNSITLLYFIPVVLLLKNNYLTKDEIIASENFEFESSWKVFGLSTCFVVLFSALAFAVMMNVQSNDDIAQQVADNLNNSNLELNSSFVGFKASKDLNGSGVIVDFSVHQEAVRDFQNVDTKTLRGMVLVFFGKDALKNLASNDVYFIVNFNSPTNELIQEIIISPSNVDSD
ncbi:MAG: hypothetical protein KJ930_13170 [Gammaproteobacteria bacterium]|nr:hypothetical protein [Gammaproteobacteria bacterium]MBU2180373.1 hypothetical protein [Gammaproteobacteria bacterium]MBU2222457.1 hypothetical protein [Gammaproteobacteria bacterium]MBU2277302.1 hypothetical protein [Gammaproteobacteria bacterium]MBU2426593.1 hypothetical protein [Gammaproteobacteria bacterium]